jgi:anti-sigma factor RsiW
MSGGPLARLRFMRDHMWAGSRFSAYLDGELGAEEGARLEHHAHQCKKCHQVLEALRQTLAALGRLSSATQAPAGLADAVISNLRTDRG